MKTENRTAPRTFQINIRLSETEYTNLSRIAALHGLGRAAYVRMLMLRAWRSEKPPKADQIFSSAR